MNFFEYFLKIVWIFLKNFLKIFWKKCSPPPEIKSWLRPCHIDPIFGKWLENRENVISKLETLNLKWKEVAEDVCKWVENSPSLISYSHIIGKHKIELLVLQKNIISVCNEMKQEEFSGEKLKSELRMRKEIEKNRKPTEDEHSPSSPHPTYLLYEAGSILGWRNERRIEWKMSDLRGNESVMHEIIEANHFTGLMYALSVTDSTRGIHIQRRPRALQISMTKIFDEIDENWFNWILSQMIHPFYSNYCIIFTSLAGTI